MMTFGEKIKSICLMKELDSVAWKITGDDQFKPEKVQVRFEDKEGTVFELVIHPDPDLYGKERNEEEVLLNIAFTHFGIIPSGEWIGVTTDISGMVNMCRKKAKYNGKFFVNEERCKKNGFENPVHVF